MATDDFNRADNSDLGANWNPQVTGGTDLALASNGVYDLASGFADGIEQYNASFSADQYSQVTLQVFTGATHRQVGAAARMAPPGTGGADVDFFLGSALRNDSLYGSKTTTIAVVVNGAQTVIASEASTTWAATDTLKLQVSGSALNLYRNGSGTPLLTASNGTYSSGALGIFITLDGDPVTDATIDAWTGDVAALANTNVTPLTMRKLT